ncbi:hypothetical protein R5H32_04335 [Defluviimonas sp. D31]|nr:hypothetical protein [Defluviimonas sp. D31]
MRTINRSCAIVFFGLAMTLSATAQDTYTIPAGLTPLATWRDGYSAADSLKFRQAYNDNTLTAGEDDGAYAIKHLSEVLPAALVHRQGPVAILEENIMPEIGEVVATTDLGTMTLKETMADERSRMEAIVVVHEGKIVF